MRFHKLAEYLEKLEATSKRLEITDILTDIIRDLDIEEADKAVYLILGYLKASFENPKFNIAEKMMMKIIEAAYSTPENPVTSTQIISKYHQNGDLGNVAYEIADKSKKSNVNIDFVHNALLEIAKIEGNGSQELKTKKTVVLLRQVDNLSAKYIVRIILGTTRLGFTELTFIDALANYIGDKSKSLEIEKLYGVHPDIGIIAKQVIEKGFEGLNKIKIEAGVPVLSQKAQRVKDAFEAIEKMGLIWAEYKFDGTRVQLHMDRNKPYTNTDSNQIELFDVEGDKFLIKTFTRNLEETTHQYPDIVQAADKQIKADSIIVDGEAIGYDKDTGDFLPFQETMQRKRKHGISAMAQEIPLKYFVFDILYLNGNSLVDKPLIERKKLLKEVIKHGEVIIVDEYIETADAVELEKYFTLAEEKGLEGLIVKRPTDVYQAGARSFSWVKLKKADKKLLDDSVDCIVLGYYAGRGNRSKFGIGGFLVGIYDEDTDTIKSISKIGTGLSDEDWVTLKILCDKLKVSKVPSNVELNKIFLPDIITQPKLVVEIGADEISESPSHTAGYALRFPRLIKFRDDKNPLEATTLNEIKKMYSLQKRGHY